MEKNKTKIKKVVLLVIVLILIGGILALIFSNRKASDFTEAEHLERVRQRIQKEYIDGNAMIREYDAPKEKLNAFTKATAFEVYPIYTEKDELKYCLVELEPYGFLYVKIRDEQLKPFSFLGASTSMYLRSSVEGEPAWTPCDIDKETEAAIWEKDEAGENVKLYHSPFFKNGVQKDERRYFIPYNDNGSVCLIPSIKRNSTFYNLYSIEECEIRYGQPQPISGSVSFINKKHFDL